MGFNTHFTPENIGSPIINFGFYKVQRQTKDVVVSILKNFFSNMVKLYSLSAPEILEIQNTSDLEKIFITQDFPYTERKIPLIIVSIGDGAEEKKMYIGADNLIGYKVLGTSTSKQTVEVYGGAYNVPINISILALTTEDRMKFAELVSLCFTHYYRWQYYYTLKDGNQFSIVPNSTKIGFSGESEVADSSKTSMIYILNLTMNAFVEYTFTNFDQIGMIRHVIIETSSGVSGEVPPGYYDPNIIGEYEYPAAELNNELVPPYGPLDVDYRGHFAVDPGNTEVIDTVGLTTTHAVKWHLILRGTPGTVMGEVVALEANGQAYCTMYGLTGTILDFDVDVSTDGTSLMLNIKNNEPQALNINFTRVRV
ncbi:MAG TPA: hypothetical protein P5136_00435 [Methanofastidiosum sp.]|nr:hypothetical protein [Methanofastidiosum sp.]